MSIHSSQVKGANWPSEQHLHRHVSSWAVPLLLFSLDMLSAATRLKSTARLLVQALNNWGLVLQELATSRPPAERPRLVCSQILCLSP